MFQLGLSPAAEAAYELALRSSHRIRISVTLRGASEQPLGSLIVPHVLTGDVQVDTTGSVSRSLSMTLLDPAYKLTFDSANPANGAVYADNFISILYGVETLLGWVDVPVFWGPVTKFDRAGPEVTIEGQGKEALGLDPHLVTSAYPVAKGAQLPDAIRKVMGKIGEQRYALGPLSGKLVRHRAVTRGESPWAVVCGGAFDSAGSTKPGLMSRENNHYRLFYDGAGYLSAKRRGGSAVWTFTDQHVLAEPGYSYDVSAARNRVEVRGGAVPKHAKLFYHGVAVLPDVHPLSAQSLARNGAPRWMTTSVQADNLKSDAACQAHAETMLAQLANEGLDATFDTLVIPHLEESDPVRLQLAGSVFSFPLKTFTIPLDHSTPMSIGASVKTLVARRRTSSGVHHHAKHHHHHVKHKAGHK